MQLSDSKRKCEKCGAPYHLYPWQCPFNLHGEGDSFKTECAVCGESIPSGADRLGDKFGNLYCTAECAITGRDELLEIATESAADSAGETTA